MMIKCVVAFVVCVGVSWFPNLNEPKPRQVIITDEPTLEKIARCENVEELKINKDLQHSCKGVTYE